MPAATQVIVSSPNLRCLEGDEARLEAHAHGWELKLANVTVIQMIPGKVKAIVGIIWSSDGALTAAGSALPV